MFAGPPHNADIPRRTPTLKLLRSVGDGFRQGDHIVISSRLLDPPTLVIIESYAAIGELLAKKLVFFPEIFDSLALTMIDPARGGDDHN